MEKTPTDDPFIHPLINTGNGAVTYPINPVDGCATIDSTTGMVTINPDKAGTATITATVADTSAYTYAVKTATYTLSMMDTFQDMMNFGS